MTHYHESISLWQATPPRGAPRWFISRDYRDEDGKLIGHAILKAGEPGEGFSAMLGWAESAASLRKLPLCLPTLHPGNADKPLPKIVDVKDVTAEWTYQPPAR